MIRVTCSPPRAPVDTENLRCEKSAYFTGRAECPAGAGYTTESGELPLPQAKTFVPEFQRHNAVNKDDVLLAITDPEIQIVDARSADRFQALAPDPRPGVRSGHIPAVAMCRGIPGGKRDLQIPDADSADIP